MKTINETTDYSIFKKLKSNRDVTKKRFNNVKESIDKVGWLSQPVLVNENMEVIDGQARLEVLKSMNLPVEYIIQPGIGINECIHMNTGTKVWTLAEMIKTKAENQISDWDKFYKLMVEFEVSPSVVAIALHNKSLKTISKNNYEISITDEQYVEARYLLGEYKKYEVVIGKFPGRTETKVSAVIYMIEHGVDTERAVRSLKKLDKETFNGSGMIHMLKSMQDAYNYDIKYKKNRIYVYESYRKGE